MTGGIGSGKSYGGAIWDISRILDNAVPMSDPKPSKSWTVAPNYRICETLLELTIQVAADVFGLREGVHFHYRRTFPRELDFSPSKLNHRVLFLSADDPTKFVSDSITHWRWSEVGVSKALVYEKLQDRLRDRRAKVPSALGEGSPEGLNHFADLANIPGVGLDRLDNERNFRRYIARTVDNVKNLSPGYLDALYARYAHDPAKIKSYALGEFVPFSKGSAYWEFIESRNTTDAMAPDPNTPIAFCWDFNVSPLAWTAAQRRRYKAERFGPAIQQVVAFAESTGEARGTLEGVAEFAARFPVSQFAYTPIHVYGDRNGWSASHKMVGSDFEEIEQCLQRAGYRRVEIRASRGANPRIKQRLETVAQLMAYKMFVVTSDCRKLISSFNKTCLKDGTWDIEKPAGEDWTHYSDSIGYYLYQEFKDTNIVDPNARPVLGV